MMAYDTETGKRLPLSGTVRALAIGSHECRESGLDPARRRR